MSRMTTGDAQNEIGTLNEGPLHASLKEWYAEDGDRTEVEVDGYLVDIVRGDLLIEIQTGNFSSIRSKLASLVSQHPVRLVYPIAQDKWIVRLGKDGGDILGRRKSPKHGTVTDLFDEMVRIPTLLGAPGFSVEVLLTQEEEFRQHRPGRAWRRKGWVTVERRLVDVLDGRVFERPADLADLLPEPLEEPFTTADISDAMGIRRRQAQRAAYCLRKSEAIRMVGKEGNAILYVRAA